jgi:hypothetical protein
MVDQATPRLARWVSSSLLCGLVSIAHAQTIDMPLYEGRWVVTLPAGSAPARGGELRLVGFDGSWRYTSGARAAKDPCKGRRMPVTIQVSRTEQLELSVWGSAVAPACPDLSLVLAPVPAEPPGQGSAPGATRGDTATAQLAGTVNGTPGVLARRQRR